MKKLFIVLAVSFLVCSVSVFAVGSVITPTNISVKLGVNGNTRNITSQSSLQKLDFNSNIAGYSEFLFSIFASQQNYESATVEMQGRFQINTDDWRYFDVGSIRYFGVTYMDGSSSTVSGSGNSTLKWTSSGKTWWCDFSCKGFFPNVSNVKSFFIEMALDDLQNVDVIIYSMLDWFSISFTVEASAQHEADRESDEQHAQESGDGNIGDLSDSIDTGNADQAGSAIQNFANAFVTNDTSAILQVPGFSLPDFLGGHTLFAGASVDFEDTVEQFPSTILLVVRSLFTVFLIIFAIKETYNLVTQFLTTGKVGGDK